MRGAALCPASLSRDSQSLKRRSTLPLWSSLKPYSNITPWSQEGRWGALSLRMKEVEAR